MPPRKASTAPELIINEEGDFEEAVAAAVESAYPAQEARTVRKNHTIKPDTMGNMQAFRFKDALDYAYTQGFIGFTDADVQIHTVPVGGSSESFEPLAVVTVFGQFYNEAGEIQEFVGVGDASPSNCQRNTAKHFVRMAETRAQARVLGRVLNLDSVFKDELSGDDDAIPSVRQTTVQRAPAGGRPASNKQAQAEDPAYWPPFNSPDGSDQHVCIECGDDVKGKGAFWSFDKTGEIYCWDHQQEAIKAKSNA